ncbi:MAG: hypothetical protein E6J14_08175 [Chloroflexi bacterium]|nr:MAG: hypothetical protein E6J14_08175 [Chloroflexota bacterium]
MTAHERRLRAYARTGTHAEVRQAIIAAGMKWGSEGDEALLDAVEQASVDRALAALDFRQHWFR